MPEVSSKTPADRTVANATNMRSRINGDMELQSSNYFHNWHFNDINEDGDPDCLRIGMPDVPDGWWVYLSEIGKDASTLAAQNDAPIPLHEVSYVSSQTWVGGRAPVSNAFAADLSAPAVPGYQIIDSTRGGFEAGVWYVAYTWADTLKRQSFLSFATPVTLSAGQGIRVTVPKVPFWIAYFNVYLSRDPTAAGSLQQSFNVYDTFQETVLLSGPFRKNSVAPSSNQTTSFTPRPPGISFISANTTLQPGTYTAAGVAVDATGSSPPSTSTDPVVVTEPMPNTALEVTPGYDENCVFDDDDPSDFVDASIRHRIFINKDGTDYLGYDPQRGSSQRTLSTRDALSIAGYTSENIPTATTVRGLLSRGTLPTDGQNGVPNPDSNPTAVPEGLAVLAPGDYYYAVSYAVRGKESLVSTPQKVTLPSTKMLRIIFPDTVNVVPDANVFERDANGIPFSHVLTSGAGSATSHPTDGTIILDTLGTITTASQTAPSHYVEFPVDRRFTYQIGATEAISTLSAGSFVEELAEYDEFSTLLATTTLLSVSGTGTVKPLSKFGPNGTAWNQATVTARLTHRFSGATVNGRVALSEFRAIPTDANYRKTIFPPKFVREPGQPDVPTSTPHPRTARKYVGRPPSSLVQAAPSNIVDAFDFETNALPGSWALHNTNTSACQQAITSSAAVGGALGWQLRKTTSATGWVYLERTFTPINRTTLAVRTKFRIRKAPTTSWMDIFKVRSGTADPDADANMLAECYLWNGKLWYQIFTSDLSYDFFSVSSFAVGDVYDIEMICKKTGDGGNVNFAFGRNGATRVFQGWKGQYNWTGQYPVTVQLGMTSSGNPSQLVEYDVDDVVLTDSGDTLSSATGTPVLQPITLTDRPFAPATVVEAEYDFETGTIPAAFTQARTPADGTTTLTAQAASAINGTYGVRASDTGTATTANVYIQRQLSAVRSSLGARARIRVVTRPTAGEVQMLGLTNDAGTLLGAITLDSTGVLYCRPYSNGVAGTSTAIATGVVNTNILHLDLVAQFTGTTGGTLSAWVQVGGSGLASARQLMFQKSTLDWSAAQVRNARAGGFNESSASSTWSFDIDSILLTDTGETAFSENWNQGPIYQIHIFLPSGTPASAEDKWGPRGYREAVLPGQQYTAAIKARFQGVLNPCQPFFFTAYDDEGNAYPLGSPFDGVFPNGVSGTVAWADYAQTFTIPANCYEVRLDSKAMGEGEYTFQEFAFSPGSSAVREVTYSTSGSANFTLDTLGAVPNGSYVSLGRKWESVGTVISAPAGTSGATAYYSRDGNGSALSGPVDDPNILTQGRYADFVVSLNGDGVSTPRLKRGSPFIRYATMSGSQQVATLLRYDRSEFPGGTIVTELAIPYLKAPHGVRVLPNGRIARQRMGDPVGLLPSCIIGAFTEEAAREIQETALDDDFYIETRDKLLRVRFSEQIEFDAPMAGSLARYQGDWRLWAEAETGDAEILELVDYTID